MSMRSAVFMLFWGGLGSDKWVIWEEKIEKCAESSLLP